jgi:hypothetical protein
MLSRGDGALALQVRLVLLPPSGKPLEETQTDLCGLIGRHFVLETAALLLKDTDTFVNPFVAVLFFLFEDTSASLKRRGHRPERQPLVPHSIKHQRLR